MAETPNCKLYVTPSSDMETDLIVWLQKMNGTASSSNMMMIDSLIAALQAEKANKVVEATTEPGSLLSGDEWDMPL